MNTPENMKAYLEQAFDRNKLIHELSNKNSLFLFLEKDNNPVGYLKINEAPSQTDINDEKTLEIERICVSGEFQGEGMGKYLMEHAINIANKGGTRNWKLYSARRENPLFMWYNGIINGMI